MPLPGIEVFIISVYVRYSESFYKKNETPGKLLLNVFLQLVTYYAEFMSLFVASKLIIVICFLLDHRVSIELIMGH